MYKILKKTQFSEKVFEFRVEAPQMAKKAHAGQFLMVRANEEGERVPFTLAGWNAEEGWIEFIFMVIGKTTQMLSTYEEGDYLQDVTGPLGNPTELEGDRVVVLGGGVGLAIAYPVARTFCEEGKKVSVIMGARTKDLLILTDQFKALPLEGLYITTDDGSEGEKGVVTAPLERLCQEGAVDGAFCVGPVPMMKFSALTAQKYDLPIVASLNPIMVDGTGMCGCCRVEVGGKTKFACVDGPDFDATQVDWDDLRARQGSYRTEEAEAVEAYKGGELRMPQVNGKYKPNMKAPRTPYVEERPEERAQDFRPVDRGYSMADAVAEANRCLDCKKPQCVEGCPVSINIPGFIEKIREGNFGGGLDIIREASLLPSVCGRVCPQENQCEGNCVLNKKGNPIAIGQLERFLGDNATELAHDPEVKPSNGKKVAVVGSGPSGIACAGELARNGYEVTVFEAFFTGGGVLTYGIPEFRLPKKIVKREIDGLEKLGVKFEYNSVVGRITDAKELFEEQGFDAMYLAVGAGLPKFLNVPGENLPGVFCANEYLTRVNLMKAEKFPVFDTPTKHGKNVVVFGGGNVAMDAARTALRLGADTVTLAYRRTEEEMPARKAELHHAKEEGVQILPLVSPVEFIADENGFVTSVKLERMELGEPDESGRRRPHVIEGSEFEIPCDVAVTAIGTNANPFPKLAAEEVSLNKWGYIEADENGRTSDPRIWAGGDIVTGAATVILAMGAGKKAAHSMMEALEA